MRICQVVRRTLPSYGGVETYSFNLAKHLSHLGYDCKIIGQAIEPSPKEVSKIQINANNMELVRVKNIAKIGVNELGLLGRDCWEAISKADLVHIHGLFNLLALQAFLASRQFNDCPILWHIHGLIRISREQASSARWKEKILFKMKDDLYCKFIRPLLKMSYLASISRATSIELKKSLGLTSHFVIPNAVDSQLFNFTTREYNKRPTILFVGDNLVWKNFPLVIEIARKLRSQISNFKVQIAGNGYSNNMVPHSLRRYFDFLGPVEYNRIPALYQKSDIVLITSFTEGIPTVMLEAMSTGAVVVANNVGGISEVIMDGKNGLLIESPFKPEDFVSKILYGIEDFKRISLEARKTITQEFDWNVVANNIVKIYNLIVSVN